MQKEKIKVYTYTRVSTAMQVDGYSLDAQKAKMKAYADYNDYEIVGEYEDAGKSGKSIEGRAQYKRYQAQTLSPVEEEYLKTIKQLGKTAKTEAEKQDDSSEPS